MEGASHLEDHECWRGAILLDVGYSERLIGGGLLSHLSYSRRSTFRLSVLQGEKADAVSTMLAIAKLSFGVRWFTKGFFENFSSCVILELSRADPKYRGKCRLKWEKSRDEYLKCRIS